jgi:hypothetical protein
MSEVVALALSFPAVVYTVLLGVVLVYWLFVVVGAIDLGDGSDGALDHLGGAKGALQGHVDLGGHADVGDVGDGDGDPDEGSTIALLANALHLKSVPVTTILSLIVTFSWLTCTVGMQFISRSLPHAGASLWAWLVFAASPLIALPLTSIAARPLKRVFTQRPATQRRDLIGKTCVVRTGTVTSSFGEALLEDGGAGLVVRVRIDRDVPVSRGDHVLIVDWDSEHESFLVEPMDELREIASPKPRV